MLGTRCLWACEHQQVKAWELFTSPAGQSWLESTNALKSGLELPDFSSTSAKQTTLKLWQRLCPRYPSTSAVPKPALQAQLLMQMLPTNAVNRFDRDKAQAAKTEAMDIPVDSSGDLDAMVCKDLWRLKVA